MESTLSSELACSPTWAQISATWIGGWSRLSALFVQILMRTDSSPNPTSCPLPWGWETMVGFCQPWSAPTDDGHRHPCRRQVQDGSRPLRGGGAYDAPDPPALPSRGECGGDRAPSSGLAPTPSRGRARGWSGESHRMAAKAFASHLEDVIREASRTLNALGHRWALVGGLAVSPARSPASLATSIWQSPSPETARPRP